MKYLFASDLHGSVPACREVLRCFEVEKADRLILLGDLLYHGPRNPLCQGYDPAAVAEMLNAFTPAPLCVRGNCDSEVDQMVLNFPIMADFALLELIEGKVAFLTHGHLFNVQNPPPHKAGDVLIHGHTHVHCASQEADYVYINPGSAALPKEGQSQSYMICENGLFTIKDMKGQALLAYQL